MRKNGEVYELFRVSDDDFVLCELRFGNRWADANSVDPFDGCRGEFTKLPQGHVVTITHGGGDR